MTAFLTPLIYEDLSQDDDIFWVRLAQPFRYYSDVLQGVSILPEGFECDGESIPSGLYSIVPPFGAARKGAIAHDGLYTFGGYFNADGNFVSVTQKTADAVYRELLLFNGVPAWRVRIRWWMLRCFGRKAWSEHVKSRRDSNLAKLYPQIKHDIKADKL